MSIAGRRLSSDQSRELALDAARRILLNDGPQAVTLKAVAAQVGRTHANLLHHFGSASGLQKALVAMLADEVTTKIGDAVQRARRGEAEPREIVDLTFDAFDTGGGGALATWMVMSGNRDALDPVFEAIHRLVDELSAEGDHQGVAEETLLLVLMALGDALFGAPMAAALGLQRGAARQIALSRLLSARFNDQLDEA